MKTYAPHIVGCHSGEVIPEEYWVSLEHGYPPEQLVQTIGTSLGPSFGRFCDAASSFRVYYSATFDNSAMTVVLKDVSVSLVRCNGRIKTILPALGQRLAPLQSGRV